MQQWSPPSFDPEPLIAELPVEPAEPMAVAPLAAQALDATQEMFLRGLQEGLEEGRQQGLALGREEGYKAGQQEGYQAGFRQAYQDGNEKIEALAQSLQALCDALQQLPEALTPALRELVYAAAQRLAGQHQLDRTLLEQLVHEAVSRLPHPPSQLVLRVPHADLDTWQAVCQDGSARYRLALHADAALAPGHAFVEFQGVRLDVGAQAREALVRQALGLIETEHAHGKA